MNINMKMYINRDTYTHMDIIMPLLSHHQANSGICVRSQFRHCVHVKLPYSPNLIP